MAGSDEGGASGQAPSLLSPAQSRAARGLLGWSTAELARRAGLAERFVSDFETERSDPASGQVEVLRSALMAAGALFTNGSGPGVSLRRPGADEGTRLDALTTENDR